MNTDEGAGQGKLYKDKGAGRHEMNKAKTEDTKDKARTKLLAIPKAEYEDGKNGNIPAKPKKLGQEDITKRATIHKVRTEDKEEAIKDVNGCKRPGGGCH